MPDWLDWLYVPQCAACSALAKTLCTECTATLIPIGAACPGCGEPIDDVDDDSDDDGGEEVAVALSRRDSLCARCRRAPLPLETIVSPWRFGGQLAVAIRRMKLGRRAHVARDLAPLWAPLIAAAAREHDALVVPVATHWKRRFSRGFDHTWLLAMHACKVAKLARPQPLLTRVHGAAPQRGMSAVERRANLTGAFTVTKPDRVNGRAIILIDDVVTTGATIAAAARALLDAGASHVIGVALARAATPR